MHTHVPLPPDVTPADIARTVVILRAKGKHRQADYLASHLPPASPPLPHLDAMGGQQSFSPNVASPLPSGGGGESGEPTEGPFPGAGGLPANGPPHPENSASAGSLPPRIDKAYEIFGRPLAEPDHAFGCVYLPIPEPQRSRVLTLGRMIPDGDLAEDGREDKPHVTALYGFHDSDPLSIFEVLSHFRPVRLKLGAVSVFAGAEYDVVKIEVESDVLHAMNAALRSLPHTNKFRDFRPHVTVAYVKPGLGALYAAQFTPFDDKCTCETAVFSDAGKTRNVYPLGRTITVQKAMSAYTDTAGGTLVAPAATGALVPLRRRKKNRKLGRVCKDALDGLAALRVDPDAPDFDAESFVFGAPDALSEFVAWAKSFDPNEARDDIGRWTDAAADGEIADLEIRLRDHHAARAVELEGVIAKGEAAVARELADGTPPTDLLVVTARAHLAALARMARERRELAAGDSPDAAWLSTVEKAFDARGRLKKSSAPNPHQSSLWDESDHPRETTAHDDKKPGEWAPKGAEKVPEKVDPVNATAYNTSVPPDGGGATAGGEKMEAEVTMPVPKKVKSKPLPKYFPQGGFEVSVDGMEFSFPGVKSKAEAESRAVAKWQAKSPAGVAAAERVARAAAAEHARKVAEWVPGADVFGEYLRIKATADALPPAERSSVAHSANRAVAAALDDAMNVALATPDQAAFKHLPPGLHLGFALQDKFNTSADPTLDAAIRRAAQHIGYSLSLKPDGYDDGSQAGWQERTAERAERDAAAAAKWKKIDESHDA